MSDFCIAGIDPGSKGAVAFIWPDAAKLLVVDLPTFRVATTRTFTYCDGIELAALFRSHDPVHSYLEKVHAMPNDGAVGAFTFGDNFGTIKGVHAGLGTPLTQVSPNVWKSNMGVTADKKQAVVRARSIAPACSSFFTRPDKAEAFLIGLYGALHLGHALKKKLEPMGG